MQEIINDDSKFFENLKFQEKSVYVLLGVNIVINILALFMILYIPLLIFEYMPKDIFLISVVCVILLSILGTFVSFQEIIVNWNIRKQRELTVSEKDFLLPLVKNVANKIENYENIHIKLEDLEIKVSTEEGLNAFVLGSKFLFVSEMFLHTEEISNKEREAIIAHEFSHLLNKDSVFLILILSGNMVMRLFGNFCIASLSLKSSGKPEDKGGETLAKIFFGILYLVFVKILSDGIFTLSLRKYSRNVEYRCDKFSADLGYRNDLLSFFYKLNELERMHHNSNNLFEALYSTHPKTEERIIRLENI